MSRRLFPEFAARQSSENLAFEKQVTSGVAYEEVSCGSEQLSVI